jgi:predicted ester cyclase
MLPITALCHAISHRDGTAPHFDAPALARSPVGVGFRRTRQYDERMSGVADPVKRMVACLEAKDVAQAATYMHDDFQFSGGGSDPLNKEQFVSLMKALFTAMPDWSYHPRELRAEGDHIRFRTQITGTHSGMLVGLNPGMAPIAATAKKVDLPVDQVECTVRDGKVATMKVESTVDGGIPGILAQIGHPLKPSSTFPRGG